MKLNLTFRKMTENTQVLLLPNIRLALDEIDIRQFTITVREVDRYIGGTANANP